MPETKLPTPLHPLIEEHPPVRSREMWRMIDAARTQRQSIKRVSRRQVPLLWAACAALVLAAVGFGLRATPAPEGPLMRHNRQPLPARMMPTASSASLDLSDGSRITVAQHARLDFLASSASAVSLALRGGRARFDVRPHGPRTWRIDCGALEVEVVGTAFTLERRAERVSVRVHRGAVLVRGQDVPDGVQRLEAGEALEVGSAPPLADVKLAPPERARQDPTIPPAQESNQKRTVRRAAQTRRRPEPALLPAHGADSRERELERWWKEADQARTLGKPQQALHPLEQLANHELDPARAALASFSLAKLYLSAFAQPRLAVEHYERALSHGLREPLVEEARARLVEAHALAGDVAAACEAAEIYRKQYPSGQRLPPLSLSCSSSTKPTNGSRSP